MIPKYLATLAVAVVFVTLGASSLQFAARSQVLAGKPVDDTFELEFVFDADSTHTYVISPKLKAELEQGITFVTEGPVHVVSSSVEITPKDIHWTEDRTNYTSPGAGLVALVKWDTPASSANGTHGFIYIHFPDIPAVGSKAPTYHSGGFQKDDQGRYVLREINTYQNAVLVSLARFSIALAVGLPVGILLHSICWAFVLRSEKRARLAALALQGQGSQLPRTFYPNPIAEWTIWTILFGIFAFPAGMISVISASENFMSASMIWVVYVILGVATVIGLIAAYFTGRSVVTVRVDSNSLSYARGRGDLQWLTVGWSEILKLTEMSRTYRGSTRYWLQLQFRDNRKKLKLGQDIQGYPALKELLFSVFKTSS
ncbi:MAG TPA: hypothetical protein VKH15_03010 [Candidatus Acidoferrum sp.]|nr:hypothetical protein [Candidatus Acidoferrum sp.]